jgi:uncharacterized repeat protein (TIGR01451 family)
LEKATRYTFTARDAFRLAGSLALFAAFAATPALSQQIADLSVTLVGPAAITFGGTATYTVTIANAGPSNATGVQLNATLPAGTRLSSIGTNCVPVNSDGKFPCGLGVIDDGASVIVNFVITLLVPSPYPTVCPAATSLGNTSVVVSSTSTDPTPGDNSATVTNMVRPYADMAVTLTGPSSANQGDTVTYQAVVTNKGPCSGSAVQLRGGFTASNPSGTTFGNITFQSNSGDCTSAFPCAFGTMNPGDTKNITSTFTIDKMPKELTRSGDPNSVNVRSSTDDPISSNNSSAVTTIVTNDYGCSATGSSPIAAIGLILLVLFAINRSRSA